MPRLTSCFVIVIVCGIARGQASSEEWSLEIDGVAGAAEMKLRWRGVLPFTIRDDGTIQGGGKLELVERPTKMGPMTVVSLTGVDKTIALSGKREGNTIHVQEKASPAEGTIVTRVDETGAENTMKWPIQGGEHQFDAPLRDGEVHDWVLPGAANFRYTLRSQSVTELKEMLKKCKHTANLLEAAEVQFPTGIKIEIGERGQTALADGVITLSAARPKWGRAYQLILELSNAAKAKEFDALRNSAKAGDLSRENFVREIEKLEFQGQQLRWQALQSCGADWGWNRDPIPAWQTKDFETFYQGLKLHAPDHPKRYEDEWDATAKAAWEKKHPR